MAGGLVGLLDDVAALAKLAAASIDDVGAAAGRASLKAAGVVVDDTAVTPAYVHGLAADRELSIVRRIAVGSVRNKLLAIVPVALVLSAVAPTLVEIVLMAGGTFLAYEGAHKFRHMLASGHSDEDAGPAVARGPGAEDAVVASAIRTDFILSAEIMVIALKEVLDEPVAARGAILVLVGLLITAVVYGLVGAIVKMDDVGLRLAQRSGRSRRLGRSLVAGMPVVLTWLSRVGVAAMLSVGGHILLAGADELGWHAPLGLLHDLEHQVDDLAGVGGALAWFVGTGAAALVGAVVGFAVATLVGRVRRARG